MNLPRPYGDDSTGTLTDQESYSEFRTFVEQTEKELLTLFVSIDRDHNGKLDKDDLRAAFKRAGLAVPNSKLDQFFSEVDDNHDVSNYNSSTDHS